MPNISSSDGSKYVGCKILECVCSHEYQDSKYGKNNRVFNPCKSADSKKTKYRCTVCRREITI